jgi:hypothetical protein
MTLEEAQKQVDQWVKTYGVRYFSELTNMAVQTEEEADWPCHGPQYGDQSFKEGEKDNIEERDSRRLRVASLHRNRRE